MKKCMKTLTALCLTVAMISTMFIGTAFASGPVYVDWYGFDSDAVSIELGEGTYTQTPVFFPADATETAVTWTSDDPAVATVDAATGVVTLVGLGTANITATLTDTTGLDDASIASGTSYALTVTPTTGISGTLQVKPAGVVLSHPANEMLTATGGVGSVTATSSNTAVATVTVQGSDILVTSANVGYAELTVTDGTNTVIVPVSVVSIDPAATKDNWLSIFPDASASANDPGYLQWYFETVTTESAGVLGYGVNTAFNVLNAADNYRNTEDRIFFNPASSYSFFYFNGQGMTVGNYYHVFAIKMPMDGTVSVGAVGEAYFDGQDGTDGSFLGVFKTTDNGSGAVTNRVFPEEVAANKQASYSSEVLANWLWLYPDKKNIGDTIYSKTLTQDDVDALAAFNKDGAVFDVQKDDIVRIVLHSGANDWADSGLRYMPSIKYVVDKVEDVLDLEREVAVFKGQTINMTPRIAPYWMAPDVTMTPEYVGTSSAALDSFTYLDGADLGKVQLAVRGAASGTGYYRLNFGPVSKLVKVAVASTDLDIQYNALVSLPIGKMLSWKVTSDRPVSYTTQVVIEETNADGSIQIDTSVTNNYAKSESGPCTEKTVSQNLGRTYAGKTANVFFFTDLDNLTLPSPNAFKVGLSL